MNEDNYDDLKNENLDECDDECDDDCECGHEDNENPKKVFITLDDDTEIECNVLGIFEANGKEYIALLPLSNVDEEDEVLIYSYSEDENGILLQNIESDIEYESVADVFYDTFDFGEDDYDFEEYDDDDEYDDDEEEDDIE